MENIYIILDRYKKEISGRLFHKETMASSADIFFLSLEFQANLKVIIKDPFESISTSVKIKINDKR